MGAGAFRSLTQVRRSVLPRLLGRVWYVQRRALSCCTGQFMPASMPLVSFRDRRILFLQDNVRQLKLRPAFLPPIWRARSANGNRRLGRLEIASSLFFLPFSLDCAHLRSPGEKGQQGVTGESRGHIFLYSWSGASGITLKQTTTWKGRVVSKRTRCIRPSLETKKY